VQLVGAVHEDLNLVQSIRLLGLRDVHILFHLLGKVLCDGARDQRAQLRQPIILVLHVLQEITRLHTLLTRQTQLHIDEAVKLSVVDGGHAMTLRPLGPTEVSADGIQDTDRQRRNTQSRGSKLPVPHKQTGRTGVQKGNSS